MGLAIPLGYQLLFALCLLVGGGALFGATVWRVGRRRGRATVALSRLVCTPLFAALYVARVMQVRRDFGFPAERQRPLLMFGMFSLLFAFALGLPTINVLRRLRSAPELRTAAIARSSAGLAFAGVLLVLILGIVADLAGVLASPIR